MLRGLVGRLSAELEDARLAHAREQRALEGELTSLRASLAQRRAAEGLPQPADGLGSWRRGRRVLLPCGGRLSGDLPARVPELRAGNA